MCYIARLLPRISWVMPSARTQCQVLNLILASQPPSHSLCLSVPYIVGSNPNSPSNPHSAMASGGNNISAVDTSPAQEAYVLYGAVVGGPNKYDDFYDIRSDWPQTEVSRLFSHLHLISTLSTGSARRERRDANSGGHARPRRHCRPVLHISQSWSISKASRQSL